MSADRHPPTTTCLPLLLLLLTPSLPSSPPVCLSHQGIASAPLYDSACGGVVGVISASDFIHMLRRLKHAVSSGSNPLSEAEMDAHTVRQFGGVAAGTHTHCHSLLLHGVCVCVLGGAVKVWVGIP